MQDLVSIALMPQLNINDIIFFFQAVHIAVRICDSSGEKKPSQASKTDEKEYFLKCFANPL